MIIDERLENNLLELRNTIETIVNYNNITDAKLEKFLRSFEKTRYNILCEIKIYNKNMKLENDKIKTINDNYKAELKDEVLQIYIPEVLPSYKNLKTHTHKRILLNVSEITKPYANLFGDEDFIYIKIFDAILGWYVDNRTIKPVADALIASNVIQDDNITKMFYAVKGEFSEIPHTEVYVAKSKEYNKINKTKNRSRELRHDKFKVSFY